MAIAFTSALYYPYIDVKNEQWLRNAVLFWDSIRTIVPISHRDPYSNDFARTLSDEGVLQPIRVSSDMEEIEALTEKVFTFLTDPASAGLIYNVDADPDTRIHNEKIPNEIFRLAQIHPEKFPYSVIEMLQRGLDDDGWLHVEPTFAKFYMTLLATQLSDRLGLGLVTESSAADQLAIAVRKGNPLEGNSARRVGRHFEASGPRRALPPELTQSLLIDLILQGISLPDNLTVHEILMFKNDHKEELSIFRREISRLTSDIPKDVPIEALRQAVANQYQVNVLPALNSLKASLKAQRWDSGINGLLKVSFFAAPSTSVAIYAGMPSAVALLVGAGISLTASVVLSSQQRNKVKIDNPYTYLLSLNNQW
ncbi:DUF6236 family protein [Klebsiella pasteurii]|uniref:DUF6236 family protein n=1 Tax=Klebsiella/Raoultella group TaxID=2890311 RepID=UPI00024FC61F|nr:MULTISPECIES: DUF6236 family protein [Klebsiella/Raoultella group]HBM3150101.1 hypothetical protein [Klebsiella oxytoca]HBX8001372.1 hypothetical protein [Klebsiella pneumoniae]EHT08356.1 hypothetical protein HMPREF9690_03086 [Raoultella ornithinolytica 10-5246]MCF6655253.1 hypothetical protein [Raoultella ornithinolytica]MDH0313290.1 ATP-binding protein [Klebsiella pasteurii]